jgi:predicted transcriptional regulator
MASALRAVGTLCFGEMGIVLNTRKPLMVKDLLDRNVVLELDGLTNSDKAFFTEALLLHIHHFRLAEGKREIFKHAIIVEEAHHIFLRKKQEITGEEAVTDVIMREIRELGEGMIIIDQHPSMLSKPALGNTYATICFNLKGRGDVETVAGSMMLDRDQKEQLANLEVGAGIVKLQDRCTKPFLIRFPLIELRKGFVTDEVLKKKMAKFYAERGSFRTETGEKPKIRASPKISKDQEKTETEKNKRNDKIEISKEELGLLECVSSNQASSVSEIYRNAKLNAYHGNRAKAALVERGLIKETVVGRSRGYVKVLELTERGAELLRSHGSKVAGSTNRKGGAAHRYWAHKVAEHFGKLGYQTFVEKAIGKGKAVDVAAERGQERIAIEISTGQSDEVWNIRKDLEAGFKKILIVCLSEEVAQKVGEQLRQAGLESQASIGLTKDFEG